MADTTTTDDPILPDESAEEAQPSQDTEQPAATQPEPEKTEEPEPSTDDNSEWLQKKGIDPSSPEAVSKLAEMYRQAEKQMHESTKKASDLEKSLQQDMQTAAESGDNDLVNQLAAEVQSLKVTQSVNSFFSSGSPEQIAEKKSFEPAMAAIVTENPTIGQLVKSGYVSYDQLYAMAKGSDSSHEQKLKADGGREALQQVANKQQAKANPGAATNSNLSSDNPSDPFLEAFNSEF